MSPRKAAGPPAPPLGPRGGRPVVFPVAGGPEQYADPLAIPGVVWTPGYILAAWDTAWKVAEILGYQLPPSPATGPFAYSDNGMRRYHAARFHEVLRGYQLEGVDYLMRRGSAVLSLPMRTGKTVTCLAAAEAVDSRATLVIGPSSSLWVWAREIAKWTGQSALILDGRGGRRALQYCTRCMGRGRVEGARCPECAQLNGQSYGYRIVEVRNVDRPVREGRMVLATPRKYAPPAPYRWLPEAGAVRRQGGPSLRIDLLRLGRAGRPQPVHSARLNLLRPPFVGPRRPRASDIEDAKRQFPEARDDYVPEYCCSKHRHVRSLDPIALCLSCRQELIAVLNAAPYVLVSYDIVIAQTRKDGAGGDVGHRMDLPGWAPILEKMPFDVAVLDEGHAALRGRPKKKRRGKSRRDRVKAILAKVPRVWEATGTLIYNYTRDAYGQLDIVTAGLFGRTFYEFDVRYCEGHLDSNGGWAADGRSLLADTELKERLKWVMLKKERSEIIHELPDKTREVRWVDANSGLPPLKLAGRKKEAYAHALAATLPHKIESIVESVIQEMAEGQSVIVFTFLRASAERMASAIERAIDDRTVRQRMRAQSARTWLITGSSVSNKAKFDMAEDFRAHAAGGASGCWVSTIDASREAISLGGAASVHYAELHYAPAAMMQSEDRAYELDSKGLSIVLWCVRGSMDEHCVDLLLPKYETQSRLTGDEQAAAAHAAFGGDSEEEDLEAVWARLTAHLVLGHG